MLEVVSLFREQGTVDELGIGPVRDAISNALFPGLSVLHTRARYLLFVPWLARELEQEHVPARQAQAKLRQKEVELIHALLEGNAGIGIIGGDARESLKRFPSVVYWGALRRFGILRHPGTTAQYLRSLASGGEAARRASRDDEGEVTEGAYGNWHGALPDMPADLLDAATFDLTIEEADYLEERFLTSVPGSLLAHLIASGSAVDVDEPWEHPSVGTARPELRRSIDHARAFSMVIHGANLLYNLVLAEKVRELHERPEDDQVERYQEQLEAWATELHTNQGFVTAWNLDDFWQLVGAHNARIHPFTRDFINRWVELALDDPDGLDSRGEGGLLISGRERRVKGPLARVADTRQLERWSGESGLGRLDYRWSGAAKAIVRDVVGARRPAEVS
jgi:hypothetical protein